MRTVNFYYIFPACGAKNNSSESCKYCGDEIEPGVYKGFILNKDVNKQDCEAYAKKVSRFHSVEKISEECAIVSYRIYKGLIDKYGNLVDSDTMTEEFKIITSKSYGIIYGLKYGKLFDQNGNKIGVGRFYKDGYGVCSCGKDNFLVDPDGIEISKCLEGYYYKDSLSHGLFVVESNHPKNCMVGIAKGDKIVVPCEYKRIKNKNKIISLWTIDDEASSKYPRLIYDPNSGAFTDHPRFLKEQGKLDKERIERSNRETSRKVYDTLVLVGFFCECILPILVVVFLLIYFFLIK